MALIPSTVRHITRPVNLYENPKSNILYRVCKICPWILSIVLRLPDLIRERLIVQEISVNERIIEHPWVYMNLEIRQGRILDVGCGYSVLPIELASLGYQVWGLDTSPYGLRHPNFRFVQEDICQTTLPDAYYNRILAISTIEHIGIGHYGETAGSNRDQLAITEICRLLKPDGKVLISVPFGKKQQTDSFRVYDSESLYDLMGPLRVENVQWYIRTADHWSAASEGKASLQDLDRWARPNGVALVVATRSN